MNLIQVAERLKDMPLNVVMQYANGMNPEVPPYVALTELERRSRMQQAAAPSGMGVDDTTVKDKLEQTMGLMAMQPAMPQSQMAPQPAANPMSGIASANVPEEMFSAAEGGIVAFSGGGDDGEEAEDETEEDKEANAAAKALADVRSPEALQQLVAQMNQRLAATAPPAVDPLAMRNDPEMLKKYPHLAILNQPIGQKMREGLVGLQGAQAKEDELQRAQLKDQRMMNLFQSLIDAGEGTRGRKGLGGLFGGFGKGMLPRERALMEKETEIRGRGLTRQKELLELDNSIEKLERARAQGDMGAMQKAAGEALERANKLGISQNTLLRGGISGLASLLGSSDRARATVEAARIRAAGAANKPEKTTDYKERAEAIYQMLKQQNPDLPDAVLRGMAAERANIGAAAATTQGRSYKDARDALRKAKLNLDAWDAYKKKFPTESDADDAFLENYMSGAMPPILQQAPSGGGGGLGSLPPASAASVARPKTQAEFDALKSGTRYINPADGRTYTKN